MNSEVLKLKTRDGWEIVGDYHKSAGESDTAVLMLHMMPATRKSFAGLAAKFQEADIPSLAIDLRGHGESQGGPDGYRNFSDKEHRDSIFDVKSGAEFLKTKGAKKIFLIGASIGANLSLQYLTTDSAATAVILLSPGLDYKGIKTNELVKMVAGGKAIYFIAANDDKYSAASIETLYDVTPDGVKRDIKIFDTGGHGTNLFQSHPELMDDIIKWLKSLIH